jgi:hypothetical protein
MFLRSQACDRDDRPGWLLAGVLFLTALCTLLVEILLTRVLSVVMWYHFTFAVISIALLGIAAGAMSCYLRFPPGAQGGGATSAFWQTISAGLNTFSLAVMLPVGLMIFLIDTPTFSWRGVLLLVSYFTACAAPFYASGYVTTALLRFGGARRVSSLYAVDLLGGALGCLVSIPLLNYLGGIGSLLIVSVLTAVAAAVLAARGGFTSRSVLAVATSVVVLTILCVQVRTARVDLRTVKMDLREESLGVLEVKWNSHSRLAMVDYFNPAEPKSWPFLAWGLSDHYKGWLPRQYLITIDGASETPVAALGEDLRKHEYLAWDVTSLPYHLRKGGKTLVIGSGGGRDVLTALWFGSQDVTAVELNQGIVDWLQGPYADFAGHVYSRPGVRLVVDDGRNFVRASPDYYDVLQISMIDTFAATSAGAYTLSENNLYTAEAFDEYLEHLSADGILSINRFFLDPPQQTLRVVTLAREALMRRGVQDPAQHLAVARKRNLWDKIGLVMVKKTPFTIAEVDQIRDVCLKMGFEPVALPGVPLDNTFTAYLQEPDPARFYQSYPFDVRPPTDDHPFFFNTFKVSSFGDALRRRQEIEPVRVYNFDAVFILFVLLALAVVCLFAFLFLPLMWRTRTARGGAMKPGVPGRQLAYFVCVGLGFILVEVVLIQRFNLYLGHPIYSLAVILVSLLAFSGLGSALTTRWANHGHVFPLAVACALVALLVLAHECLWPYFLQQTLGLALATRIALAVAALLPIGLSMGMPYPLGLRVVAHGNPDGMPWVWAVNAAASVLGSVLAFALAMVAGFTIVLLAGAFCYVGALCCAGMLRPCRQASPATSEEAVLEVQLTA